MSRPGDRPHLALEDEPLPFLHPDRAGTATPRHQVGARPHLALEEEPAQWVDHPARAARSPLPSNGPDAAPDGRADRGALSRTLPATGARVTGVAVLLLGLAWALRRREAIRQ